MTRNTWLFYIEKIMLSWNIEKGSKRFVCIYTYIPSITEESATRQHRLPQPGFEPATPFVSIPCWMVDEPARRGSLPAE